MYALGKWLKAAKVKEDSDAKHLLRIFKEIERDGVSGRVEVFRKEGFGAVGTFCGTRPADTVATTNPPSVSGPRTRA